MICKAPFTSQACWADGTISMCCHDQEHMEGELQDEWNSPLRMQTRREFLDGKIPDRCKACYSREKDGMGEELVSQYEAVFPDGDEIIARCNPDGSMDEPPAYLHLSPSSRCTLACRMCYDSISNTYNRVFSSCNSVNSKDLVGYVSSVAHNLRHYVFHGGDPITDESFIPLLDALYPHREQVEINVITNGTTLKSQGEPVIPILKDFPKIMVTMSIDSIPEVNEYQRVFTKTHRNIENFNTYCREIPQARMGVHFAVTNMTVMHLRRFFEEVLLSKLDRLDCLSFFTVKHPPIYAPHVLPELFREKALAGLGPLDAGEHTEIWDKLRANIRANFDTPFDASKWRDFLQRSAFMDRQIGSKDNVLTVIML